MVLKLNLYKFYFYFILNSILLLYVLRIFKNFIEFRLYGFVFIFDFNFEIF